MAANVMKLGSQESFRIMTLSGETFEPSLHFQSFVSFLPSHIIKYLNFLILKWLQTQRKL